MFQLQLMTGVILADDHPGTTRDRASVGALATAPRYADRVLEPVRSSVPHRGLIPLALILIWWLIAPAAAVAQTVLFHDDFEGGFGNWSMDGLWNAASEADPCGLPRAPFPSSANCVWYGVDATCNYERPSGAPSYGYLTLMPYVSLPAADGRAAYLRYWNAIDTEHCCDCYGYDGTNYDISSVEVITDTGTTWQILGLDCNGQQPNSLNWHMGRMDVSAFLGQNIRIRFRLWTLDDNCNFGFGWWIDDVSLQLEAGFAYCESGHIECPCSNGNSHAGNCTGSADAGVGGCWNSTSRQAELSGGGTPHIGADNVRLIVTDMPASTSLLFVQGNADGSGAIFGDGRRCITGGVIRLAFKTASGGQAAYPGPGDQPISVMGALPSTGGTRVYQVYYRDVASFCTAATFNLSNGLRITWTP